MNNRRPSIRWLALLGVVSLFLSGCCTFSTTRALDNAKDLAKKGDFSALSKVEVSCKEDCEGCNQLHLLKGDACYRLAKQGANPETGFSCAVQELTQGIHQTKKWDAEYLQIGRAQWYENLSESLRNLRDLKKGNEAEGVNNELLERAIEFRGVEPQNVCATYYINNAKFAKQRYCLQHPENCSSLCAELNEIHIELDEASKHATGSHCRAPIEQAIKESLIARQLVKCP